MLKMHALAESVWTITNRMSRTQLVVGKKRRFAFVDVDREEGAFAR